MRPTIRVEADERALLLLTMSAGGVSPAAKGIVGGVDQAGDARKCAMIIKAGTKVQCSQGHVYGEVTSDIETHHGIVVPAGGKPPFTLDMIGGFSGGSRSEEWCCKACGEMVARHNGSTWQIFTQHGWIG